MGTRRSLEVVNSYSSSISHRSTITLDLVRVHPSRRIVAILNRVISYIFFQYVYLLTAIEALGLEPQEIVHALSTIEAMTQVGYLHRIYSILKIDYSCFEIIFEM